MNYYNDNDPYAMAWARELIRQKHVPEGHCDEQSINPLKPESINMAMTRKQRRRSVLSASLRQWFGAQRGSAELDATNRAVEKRKWRQYRHKRKS